MCSLTPAIKSAASCPVRLPELWPWFTWSTKDLKDLISWSLSCICYKYLDILIETVSDSAVFLDNIVFKTPPKIGPKTGSLPALLNISSVPKAKPNATPIGCAASQVPLRHRTNLAPKVAILSKGEFLTSKASDFNNLNMC